MKKIVIFFAILVIWLISWFMANRINVSVIVPVYNAEEYLDECLASLEKQTLKNIEFIVIDDGSVDSSYKIMEKFAENDDRFRIFRQENQGVGKTRNRGIKIAKGKYIGFVDSDDFVSRNYFEKLYKKAMKYDADVSIATHFIRFSEEQKQYNYSLTQSFIENEVLENIDFLIGNLGQQWDKIYKKSFIEKYGIKCYGKNLWFEDEWFSSLVALYAKKIAITDENMYFYRYNKNGITQNFIVEYDLFWSGLELYKELLNIIEQTPLNEENKKKILKQVYVKIDWYINFYWIFGEKTEELKGLSS